MKMRIALICKNAQNAESLIIGYIVDQKYNSKAPIPLLSSMIILDTNP